MATEAWHHVRDSLARHALGAARRRLKGIHKLLDKAQEDLAPEQRLELSRVLVDFSQLPLAPSLVN